jgi:hypothetical protein
MATPPSMSPWPGTSFEELNAQTIETGQPRRHRNGIAMCVMPMEPSGGIGTTPTPTPSPFAALGELDGATRWGCTAPAASPRATDA